MNIQLFKEHFKGRTDDFAEHDERQLFFPTNDNYFSPS